MSQTKTAAVSLIICMLVGDKQNGCKVVSGGSKLDIMYELHDQVIDALREDFAKEYANTPEAVGIALRQLMYRNSLQFKVDGMPDEDILNWENFTMDDFDMLEIYVPNNLDNFFALAEYALGKRLFFGDAVINLSVQLSN